MFITYSSFYPSHKYFVFIITCQVPYNGLLYADEQNLVPTSKNSQANERNTRKMKFLWMVAELHKKESILEIQISPFIQSHETLESVITSDSILLLCPPILTLHFIQHPLICLQRQWPQFQIFMCNPQTLYQIISSMSQKCNHQILTFTPWLRLSPATQKALLPLHHFLSHPNPKLTFNAQSKYHCFPLSCLLLLQQFTSLFSEPLCTYENLHPFLSLVVPIHWFYLCN